MYSITNVIIGVPITQKLSNLVNQWEEDDDSRWREWKELGFETFYSGAGSGQVGYCGVQLGEFDECGDFLRVEPDALFYHSSGKQPKKIRLTPNQKQLDTAHEKVQAVDPELLKLCPPFGVYLVMSTS